uniref:C-type lectin domain-containing protein n=1 Tax=Astatotilapia calliptera TaxID=8154 RepID=A0A3P8NKD4_ASTCA
TKIQNRNDKNKKSSCNKSFPSLATCWGILLLIMVLRFYFSTVLEKQIANLTEETQTLKKKNEDRAQWSIDAYCPKEKNNRKCNACQAGWLYFESSCYAVNNVKRAEWKTWEEARNCGTLYDRLHENKNIISLKTVSKKSWKYDENKGYWIGLRVEDGIWKWLDGRNLTNSSWMNQPPSDGHCAVSVQDEGFKSVSCAEKNPWICNKKALSV